MDKIFEVVKNELEGWDVIDTRTIKDDRPGLSVDWQQFKSDAVERCKLWNQCNPVPELKV